MKATVVMTYARSKFPFQLLPRHRQAKSEAGETLHPTQAAPPQLMRGRTGSASPAIPRSRIHAASEAPVGTAPMEGVVGLLTAGFFRAFAFNAEAGGVRTSHASPTACSVLMKM